MILIILFPFLLVLTVTVHYGFLTRLMAILDNGWEQSIKLIAIICGLFVAHVVEIVVYTFVYYFSHLIPGFGELPGTSFDDWVNTLYFSFVAYSSLGAGDLSASGWLIILYGLEAINGLVLITWSASFSLLAMNRMKFCQPCSERRAIE
ncbi:ion channel [Methylophaga thalassica]|uniref:ion channel n=1 Tax=Methylophaga thalassica TaxID=40223 RepID=UPI002E7B518F|nr:ion channel [Methylophaga thalassica]WVI83774.1 ion channel [Methylophaga thalassica]